MKNIIRLIIHTVLSVVHTLCEIYLVYKMIQMNFNTGLVFAIFSTLIFIIYLFSWIAPKLFFNLCWKITSLLPDTFDYETSYSKTHIMSFGLFVTSFIILLIGFLII